MLLYSLCSFRPLNVLLFLMLASIFFFFFLLILVSLKLVVVFLMLVSGLFDAVLSLILSIIV